MAASFGAATGPALKTPSPKGAIETSEMHCTIDSGNERREALAMWRWCRGAVLSRLDKTILLVALMLAIPFSQDLNAQTQALSRPGTIVVQPNPTPSCG